MNYPSVKNGWKKKKNDESNPASALDFLYIKKGRYPTNV